MPRILSLALLTLLLAEPLLAQDLVTYADGTARIGRLTRRRGEARLVTPFGERRDPADQVTATSPAAPLLELYRFQAEGLPPKKLAAHQALARWCHQRGCLPGLKEQLERILAIDPQDAVAHEIVVSLASEFRLAKDEGSERGRDQRAAAKYLFKTVARRGALEAALVAAKAQRFDPDLRFRYAMSGINDRHASVRWIAARLLGPFHRKSSRINPLYKRSLADPEPAVRAAAVSSLKGCDDDAFVRLFVKNLANPKQAIRMNAADALAALGSPKGIAPLVAAMADGGSAPRRHIRDTTAVAYVKDFDVEIAQAAVIADPIVDVVQEGTILDVAVVSVSIERRHYGRALARLAGVDFGGNAGRWRAWLEEREKSERKKKREAGQ